MEWNGPAYSPGTNALYVGSIDWCTTVRVQPASKLKGKLGIPWTGSAKLTEPFGRMDPKAKARGWLTAIDADQVKNTQTLRDVLARRKVGDQVQITVRRGGQQQRVPLTLGARPTS